MLINHLIIEFLFLLHKVKNSFLRLFIDISSNRSKFCRTVILLYAESRDSDYCGTNFQNRQFVTYRDVKFVIQKNFQLKQIFFLLSRTPGSRKSWASKGPFGFLTFLRFLKRKVSRYFILLFGPF